MAGAGEPVVRDVPGEQRFEVVVGGEVAGYCAYRVLDGRVSLLHTEIDPWYEGRGLGSALVRGVLDELRARGVAVLPHCPFVQRFLGRHPEYLDLVPAADRGRFGLPTG